MHPNPVFRNATQDQNLAFARERAFGCLSVNGPDGPMLAHVPFQLSEDGHRLEAHLVRSNPIARALRNGELSAVIAVSGGDGYVSPDWYGIDDQVPTWNYIAVHLRGTLKVLPDGDLLGILTRLTAALEARLAPKPAWTLDKMSGGVAEKMMRQIVPVAMQVEQVDGTWKLGQNKPDDVRHAAAQALDQTGFGQNRQWVAKMMKNPPAQD